VTFRLPLDAAPEEPSIVGGKSKIDRPRDVLFSGDLLFAGSIGRTDLPGGDYPTILRSLARVCLTLPDETLVLSGHGPQTTIGAERRTNPFLDGLSPEAGPSRGL
jgi:glyoxylase-like metal-dependent hydrolase (beta-lactamase superfamily II)